MTVISGYLTEYQSIRVSDDRDPSISHSGTQWFNFLLATVISTGKWSVVFIVWKGNINYEIYQTIKETILFLFLDLDSS